MPSSSDNRLSILRHRNFTLYLFAKILGTIAVQMQNVAIGWQVYAHSGKVFDLGMIGLAQFAPFVVLVLIAGQVADRWNRRLIIMLCFVAQAICGLLLLLLTITGMQAIWPVFVILVLFGSARAFIMPASQAILINLVPSANFSSAVALGSSSFHIAVITGPVLGGLFYLAGATTVYAVVTLLLGISAVLMLLVRTAPHVVRREPTSWHTLLEGLRFVRAKPIILGAISLDLFAVLFGGATALLPAYARDVLDVGPTGLGMLRTGPGVGAALTAIWLAFRPISRHVGYWMFGGVALYGAATIVFGISTSFALSMVMLLLMGAGDMVSVYIRHILVQFETPDEIRGRVSAVNAVFIGASNELGEFESGITAKWFRLVPAVVIGGGATLVVTVAWMMGFPILRKMDRFPHD